MSIDARQIMGAVGIGVGASLLMDGWNLLLKRAFGIPSLNYCLLGRWLRHMPEGEFVHQNIFAAEARSYECPIGWAAHYSIGISLAFGFLLVAPAGWLLAPTLLAALIYGIVTVAFPFFLMQPALGLGIAASRTTRPAQARLKSLATHTIFGLGLYLSAVVLLHLIF